MNQDSFLNPIYDVIEKKVQSSKNLIAIFDADGTLWKNDVGIEFFQYQIQKKWITDEGLLKELPLVYKRNALSVCAGVVQKNEGICLEQYQNWCQDFLTNHPLNLFSFQKKLIKFLKKRKISIWVVSASSQWLVKESIQYYDLWVDRVIGVKTKLENNIITNQIQQPVPFGTGKVEAFLKCSQNVCPFFVSGNTLSDEGLLNISTDVRLVVASAKKGERQYEKEQALLNRAKKESWFYYTECESN